MTIDEIKKFQAQLGIKIEACKTMKLDTLVSILSDAMDMSAEFERLKRKVDRFCEDVEKP